MAETDKVKLVVTTPTAEGIAALVERLTGQKPDLQRIKDRLAAAQSKPKPSA